MSHKQVLIWNKSLNCRKGKIAAQTAHASVAAFKQDSFVEIVNGQKCLCIPLNDRNEPWLTGIFKKVCVSVKDEQELIEMFNKARELNIYSSLIQDAGLTEFGGVPTYTAVGIGPDSEEKINTITGDLPLL